MTVLSSILVTSMDRAGPGEITVLLNLIYAQDLTFCRGAEAWHHLEGLRILR